ncbi:MAG: class I SAM-dependent methyltransferase [Thiotrichales bacterium]|nr:class I SAM-dependent methyltransferase [Thiotrichales bacterium]
MNSATATNPSINMDGKVLSELLTVFVENVSAIVGSQTYINYRQLEGLTAIYNTLPIEIPLPQMREWPVSPDFAMIVATEILVQKPEIVLETGSGVSSLVAGYAVKKNGRGKVIALEHDEIFFQKTQQLIKAHRLENCIDLHLAPLVKYVSGTSNYIWYDTSNINFSGEIGVYIVDGPPGISSEHTRYPVLPVFADKAAESAMVFLDDAARDEEIQVVNRWLSEFPSFELQKEYFCEKGVAVLKNIGN